MSLTGDTNPPCLNGFQIPALTTLWSLIYWYATRPLLHLPVQANGDLPTV